MNKKYQNQLDRVEQKLDYLIQRPTEATPRLNRVNTPSATDPELLFHGWTIKQHVCLQMVFRSASNEEIAERMEVTVNTAKTHVRTLFRKLGVNSRTHIVAKCLVPFNGLDDTTYKKMTGGLPKDWDENYKNPDPYHSLIYGKKKAGR